MIYNQSGVTVTFALLVSLLVSFTRDPMLSSIWQDPESEKPVPAQKVNPVRRVALGFNNWFERMADKYPGGLRWSLTHRKTVLAAGLASVVAAFMILPALGFTWMPEIDADEFSVSLRTDPSSRLEFTTQRALQLAEEIRKDPAVEFTYASVGGGFRGTANNGSIFVRLKHDRERSMFEVQDDIRPLLRMPGVRANIQGTRSIFGGFRQPIQINVQGPEPTRLKIAAQQVQAAVRSVPCVAEPTSIDERETPQLCVTVVRQAACSTCLGVCAIASTLQPLFSGFRATEWEDALGYSHD